MKKMKNNDETNKDLLLKRLAVCTNWAQSSDSSETVMYKHCKVAPWLPTSVEFCVNFSKHCLWSGCLFSTSICTSPRAEQHCKKFLRKGPILSHSTKKRQEHGSCNTFLHFTCNLCLLLANYLVSAKSYWCIRKEQSSQSVWMVLLHVSLLYSVHVKFVNNYN